jgi:hypothetical protein
MRSNHSALDAVKEEIPGLLGDPFDNSKRSHIERMVPAAVEALKSGL